MRLARTLFAATCLVTVAFAQYSSLNDGRSQVNWSPYLSGDSSTASRQGVQVLETENAFRSYWQSNFGKDPMSAPRDVNWARERLIAVNLGQRKTGGFRVQVQRIVKSTDGIARILVIEWTPVPGAFVTDAITSPWILVKVDRTPMRFVLDVQPRQTPPGLPFVPGSNVPNNGGGRPCTCTNCKCGCGCGG